MKRYPPRPVASEPRQLDYAQRGGYVPREPPRKEYSLPASIALGLGLAAVMLIALLAAMYFVGWRIFVE
jgi:hypothetical protein